MTKQTNLAAIFSNIHTFEEFEQFKLNVEALKVAATTVTKKHQLPEEPLILFSEGTNIVFSCGNTRVIKIYPAFHLDQFKNELLVLQHLAGKLSVKTPVVECEGEIFGWPYIVMTQLEGTLLETLWEKMDHHNKIIIMHELGALIREVHSLSTTGLEDIDCHWQQFIDNQIDHCLEQHRSAELPEFLLREIHDYLSPIHADLLEIKKPVLLTGEYTPMNFLVKQTSGIWHIDGLIDFGDCMLGLPQYDLLGPGAFLIQGDKELLREFLISYGYSPNELTNQLSHKLTALMLLHKYSNLNIQIRIKDWKNKVRHMKDLENLVWGVCDASS